MRTPRHSRRPLKPTGRRRQPSKGSAQSGAAQNATATSRPATKTGSATDLRTNTLYFLLDSLTSATALVRVAHRSLRYLEIAGAEELVLAEALERLDRLHVDLDAAALRDVRAAARDLVSPRFRPVARRSAKRPSHSAARPRTDIRALKGIVRAANTRGGGGS